jgi:hypothetical protein
VGKVRPRTRVQSRRRFSPHAIATARRSLFAQIVNGHLAMTQNRGGRVGHADCFLIDSRRLLTLAPDEMRTVALSRSQRTFSGRRSSKALPRFSR